MKNFKRMLLVITFIMILNPFHAVYADNYDDWTKIYTVWEANRKVFLYPEDWLQPELRGGYEVWMKMFNDWDTNPAAFLDPNNWLQPELQGEYADWMLMYHAWEANPEAFLDPKIWLQPKLQDEYDNSHITPEPATMLLLGLGLTGVLGIRRKIQK